MKIGPYGFNYCRMALSRPFMDMNWPDLDDPRSSLFADLI